MHTYFFLWVSLNYLLISKLAHFVQQMFVVLYKVICSALHIIFCQLFTLLCFSYSCDLVAGKIFLKNSKNNFENKNRSKSFLLRKFLYFLKLYNSHDFWERTILANSFSLPHLCAFHINFLHNFLTIIWCTLELIVSQNCD